MTSLTRLDLGIGDGGTPIPKHEGHPLKGVQLPGLRAAYFDEECNLADIVAFAPNLEHLYCANLEIGDGRPAALPTCTYFGGYFIFITTHTEPAHAFAAAFPNLQVVTYMPSAAHTAAGQFTLIPAPQLLAQLPSVRAVRGWSWGVAPWEHGRLQLAPQLQRLCLYGMETLEIPSISSTCQLQHVCIMCLPDDPSYKKPQALLHALALLPQLQSLVLPAGVLCSQCCPGVQSSLAALTALTAKSSLKQLVFLEWQNTYNGGVATDLQCLCTHPEAIQAGLQSIAAEAASTQEQQQQQQQQLTILHQQQQQQRPVMTVPFLANPDSAAGVWGVYGPPGEW